jgi:DNA-binding response OmpR family regulator
VLVASGYSKEEGTALLAREGVRGFLAKPFSIEDLRERIQAALGPDDEGQGVAEGPPR